jgi:hypothetical protein
MLDRTIKSLRIFKRKSLKKNNYHNKLSSKIKETTKIKDTLTRKKVHIKKVGSKDMKKILNQAEISTITINIIITIDIIIMIDTIKMIDITKIMKKEVIEIMKRILTEMKE